MSKQTTNNGKRGGMLDGKPHSKGGIKAVVSDDNGRPVELEGGEAIITKKAVKKHHKLLSKINQDGGGVPIVAPDSNELSKGVKVEKEHAGTAKKLFSHKITPSQAPESIAKEHLNEDPKYYSKLAQVEHHAHGGTVKVDAGFDVKIGDEIWLKSRWVTITNITDKWVIFTDQNDGKRKDNPIATFIKNAGNKRDVQTTFKVDDKSGLIVVDASKKIELVTDPAKIQQLQNAITEGELILKAGTSNGKKQSAEQLEAILKSVNNARAKLGLTPSSAYTPAKPQSKSSKFSVGEWVGVIDSQGTITEKRKIAKALYTSYGASSEKTWSYRFEKSDGTTETSAVGEKWLTDIDQPKFTVGQKVKVEGYKDEDIDGLRFDVQKIKWVVASKKWAYLSNKIKPESWWTEDNLVSVKLPNNQNKAKFYKGDYVRFKQDGSEYVVFDSEYIPEEPYKHWVYKVVSETTEKEYEFTEKQLEPVYASKHDEMPLAKKHADKKSHTKLQPSPVDFDTMDALNKWVSKNLENKFEVTLKSRTDVAILQLSTQPEAKAMINELSEMRKNINQYIPDEVGN